MSLFLGSIRWTHSIIIRRRLLKGGETPLIILLMLLLILLAGKYYVVWTRRVYYLQGGREFRQHIFVYKSFIYHNSSTFADSHHPDTLVTLLATDRDYFIGPLYCSALKQRSTARVIRIESLHYCRLRLYAILCPVPSTEDVSIFFKYIRHPMKMDVPLLESVRPTPADHTPRQLVVCLSRVFAFENWPLLLVALELYRHQGVDLVVTHITSAITAVFEIMRIYERSGHLAIRPAVVFPGSDDDMLYNPNMQTEFSNQLPLAHECFYEFRESATFIALLDWDDLLMGGGSGSGNSVGRLADTFNLLSHRYPMAAYFSVRRVETLLNGDAVVRNFSSLRSQLGTEQKQLMPDPKMVVQPLRLYGFWIHDACQLVDGFNGVTVPIEDTLIYHRSGATMNENASPISDTTNDYTSRLNVTEMENSFDVFSTQWNLTHILASLPTHMPYFDAITRCTKEFRHNASSIMAPRCLSYAMCDVPKLMTTCVNARNKFVRREVTQSLWIHQRVEANLIEEHNGCLI